LNFSTGSPHGDAELTRALDIHGEENSGVQSMGIDMLPYVGTAILSGTLTYGFVKLFRDSHRRKLLLDTEIACEKAVSEAKLKAKHTLDSAEFELSRMRLTLEEKAAQLNARQVELEQRASGILTREQTLAELESKAREQETVLQGLRTFYAEKLEALSSASIETIRKELHDQVAAQSEEELKLLKRKLREQSDSEIEAEAREILLSAIQRISSNPSTETMATIVDLPSDDMKGRIIGREGRNIRSFEAVTGTTLMIDETPDTVLISAFDPVKREIARLTLESLLRDGRIHPSTIEAAYEKAKTEVQENVQNLGEEAMARLKLKPAHPEILKLLGQLHFRMSLNQNSLDHSIEVAFIASMLASELGLNPNLAKRAALFHDIGKAMDHEFEGSHALMAAKLLERYNEHPSVINAVASSHEEVPATSIYAPLVMIADRVSAMRPGARCDSMDSFVERVKCLESIARSFDGVKDAFALQAGREIRVIVEPNQLSDDDAKQLARDVSREIEDSMNYPSTIKITVIREQRFCETAK
jgi:ribonucrease Y